MKPDQQTALMAANRGFAIWRSRRDLIEALVGRGWAVHVLVGDDSEFSARLEESGATVHHLRVRRGGAHPADASWVLRAAGIYRRVRPTLAHHFHAKPVILGAFAARAAAVPVALNTITGIGESLPDSLLGGGLSTLGYRNACRRATYTVFQNPEDRTLFIKRGLVPPDRARLIISSGVDMSLFRPTEGRSSPARVLFMSRLLWNKGVDTFVQVAREVSRKYGERVSFELAGERDLNHPDAISESQLGELTRDGSVQFVGYCRKPEIWLRGATAFVCSTTYREGVPRTVLEASACAVPVIASDVPGVREAVDHGRTGFLVPPADTDAIRDRVEQLIEDKALLKRMGRDARAYMETRFALSSITAEYLSLYEEALERGLE